MKYLILITALFTANSGFASTEEMDLKKADVLYTASGESKEYGSCYYELQHQTIKVAESVEDGNKVYPVRLFVGSENNLDAFAAFELNDKLRYGDDFTEKPSSFYSEYDGYDVAYNDSDLTLTVTTNQAKSGTVTGDEIVKIVIRFQSKSYTDPVSYTLTVRQKTLFGSLVRDEVDCKNLSN